MRLFRSIAARSGTKGERDEINAGRFVLAAGFRAADTFVDFERGLNAAPDKLRPVLCDTAGKPG